MKPNPKCPSCSSCGMPLEKKEDFALSDPARELCRYCVDEKGALLPWERILEANANYYRESQGLTHTAALKMAEDLLRAQPAWKAS